MFPSIGVTFVLNAMYPRSSFTSVESRKIRPFISSMRSRSSCRSLTSSASSPNGNHTSNQNAGKPIRKNRALPTCFPVGAPASIRYAMAMAKMAHNTRTTLHILFNVLFTTSHSDSMSFRIPTSVLKSIPHGTTFHQYISAGGAPSTVGKQHGRPFRILPPRHAAVNGVFSSARVSLSRMRGIRASGMLPVPPTAGVARNIRQQPPVEAGITGRRVRRRAAGHGAQPG